MPRRPGQKRAEPFYLKSRGTWYVRIKGRKLRLSDDKEEAWQKYYELMAANDVEERTVIVATLAELFLRDCNARVGNGSLSKDTYQQYGFYIARFVESFARTKVANLKPFDVSQWLEDFQAKVVRDSRRRITNKRGKKQKTRGKDGRSSASAAGRAVRRLFRWACRQGLIRRNPVEHITVSATPRRNVIVGEDVHAQFVAATSDGAFLDVLEALKHTGCRPSELCRVTTNHVVDNKCWILTAEEHKTGERTQKPRIVRLTSEMQKLTRRLVAKRKPGECLFLNTAGTPWTRDSIATRFTRLKAKLQITTEECAYAYRHTGMSNCIYEGEDIVTVAELFGTSPAMVMKHYGHLLKSDDEMQAAQEKAVGRKRRRKTG